MLVKKQLKVISGDLLYEVCGTAETQQRLISYWKPNKETANYGSQRTHHKDLSVRVPRTDHLHEYYATSCVKRDFR